MGASGGIGSNPRELLHESAVDVVSAEDAAQSAYELSRSPRADDEKFLKFLGRRLVSIPQAVRTAADLVKAEEEFTDILSAQSSIKGDKLILLASPNSYMEGYAVEELPLKTSSGRCVSTVAMAHIYLAQQSGQAVEQPN